MLQKFIEILHYISIANISFILCLVLFRHFEDKRGKYAALFLISSLSYLLLSLDTSGKLNLYVKQLLHLGIIGLSFFFWILTSSIFDDNFYFGKRHKIVLLTKYLISLAAYPFAKGMDWDIIHRKVNPSWFLPGIIYSVLLVVLAMIETYKGKYIDLIEERRKLREIHIYSGGTVIVFIIFSYLLPFSESYKDILVLINMLLITILIFGFMFFSIDFKMGIFEIKEKVRETNQVVDLNKNPIYQKLIEAFEVKKIYITEGLSIRELAIELKVQEYKLRQLINQGMGYKNFNDFLNRYRVQEACEILLSEDKKDIPIIRIAMDLGYQSIGPFNRAFKELTGQTPSEYRKQGKNFKK
ncbi:MAG: AraC family transcriptional regulator [Leptospiraceae bacterium]|nr:AraC family transcriptional regulator [Leptospiraceae bacterium]MCP5499391.1 AraC family transcriptional regulator [Leptospiraceae bacterium]